MKIMCADLEYMFIYIYTADVLCITEMLYINVVEEIHQAVWPVLWVDVFKMLVYVNAGCTDTIPSAGQPCCWRLHIPTESNWCCWAGIHFRCPRLCQARSAVVWFVSLALDYNNIHYTSSLSSLTHVWEFDLLVIHISNVSDMLGFILMWNLLSVCVWVCTVSR